MRATRSRIAWLVRNHPELADSQISKLLGTTKQTIQSIRDKSHWNSSNIQPVDPVALGLCRQIDLDAAVRAAAAKKAKEGGGTGAEAPAGEDRLMSTEGYQNMLDALPPDTMHAEPQTMIDFLGRLTEAYGSVTGYVRDAGVTSQQIERLRGRLLAD